MAPAGLSAFEARRRENVANNAKLLQESQAIGKKMARAAKPPPKPVAPRKRKAAEPVQRTRVMPTRQSARLSGGGADTELESLKTQAEIIEEQKPAKRSRMTGDIALSKATLEGSRWANGDALASFAQGAQPGVRTFTDDDIKDTSDEKLISLRKGMAELELYDGWLPNDIKITPERIYSLAFHPIQDKPILLAGDKKGIMGVFDGSQAKPEYDDDDDDPSIPLPKVSAFEMHSRTISSIIVPQVDHNSVISASYDSTIRCLDLSSQVSSAIWQPEDEDVDLAITCVDMSAEQKDVLIFSTMQGSLGRLDRRSKGKAELWNLTDNKIGGFSLNPSLPHLVATASLDRTLKIWDLRMIKGKGEMRHPSLVGEHTSRLSVSHASWSRSGHVATSSYDDTVKIYDFEKAAKWKPGHDITDADMEPVTQIHHNNQTGRWVTILKPQWQLNPADGVGKFAIANMNRFVDVFDSEGKQLVQLSGEGITAVPAVAELHPTHNWVAAGTGSGKLCLWISGLVKLLLNALLLPLFFHSQAAFVSGATINVDENELADRAALTLDQSVALKTQNDVRQQKNLTLLAWDATLVQDAQTWANHLAKIDNMQHSTSDQRPNEGENLAYAWSSNGVKYPLTLGAQGWMAEQKNYHNEIIPQGDFASYGHYSTGSAAEPDCLLSTVRSDDADEFHSLSPEHCGSLTDKVQTECYGSLYPGVALVTGAAGTGIGAAVAKAFAAAGCIRIAITDRNADLLISAQDTITSAYRDLRVYAKAGDISDPAFVQSFVDDAVTKFGRLDYAVNCAGVPGTGQRCTETSMEDFDGINSINYRGVWLSSRAELGAMVRQEPLSGNVPGRAPARGAIVNIASQLGIVSKARMGPYCASKTAVLSLTHSDAIDYSKDGIRVNCVWPGVIETPMTVWDKESRAKQEPFIQNGSYWAHRQT
ncbi:WD domain-containing protein [Seiridium cupressi]